VNVKPRTKWLHNEFTNKVLSPISRIFIDQVGWVNRPKHDGESWISFDEEDLYDRNNDEQDFPLYLSDGHEGWLAVMASSVVVIDWGTLPCDESCPEAGIEP
jgi:hypothetical protein